jgi:hypothetical protein
VFSLLDEWVNIVREREREGERETSMPNVIKLLDTKIVRFNGAKHFYPRLTFGCNAESGPTWVGSHYKYRTWL